MKPETPLGALAAAIHLDTYDSHPTPCDCLWWRQDVDQAQRLLEGLTELGWLPPAPMVSLPESVPAGREGRLDLTDFTEQVLYVVIAHGPLTTESLNDRYEGYSERLPGLFPKRKWDTPRKRLSELGRAGFVRQAGTDNGFGVWEATDKGRQAAGELLGLAEAS